MLLVQVKGGFGENGWVTPYRPFSAYLHTPYETKARRALTLYERPSEDQLWIQLHRLARVADKGRALFPYPRQKQNQYWAEFGNYIRQAAAYWGGAEKIEGSSAALVYYYGMLNLAKAELMLAIPASIFNSKINHGLTFNHLNGKGPKSDILTVQSGVFPELYRLRTGRPLPTRTALPIKNLMSSLPEIALEFRQSGLGVPRPVLGYHALVADETQAWNVMYVMDPEFLADRREPATRHILKSFRQVELPSKEVRLRLFGLSSRTPNSGAFYENKVTFSEGATPDYNAATFDFADTTHPYSESPGAVPCDVVLAPSLRKSSDFPMPPALARYAIMFYLSSLVRYRPSSLDPVRHPEVAWLMDSFVSQSPLPALIDSTSHIAGHSITYEPGGYRS